MIDNFRYEDVETLTPVEQPCLTALFLQSDLALLRLYAEHKSTPAENTAATLVEIVDCLERLFDSLKEESTRLALREVHATAGRKVRFAEGWYGSYCEAARAAGRLYYRAIYAAADPDGYVEWLLTDTQNSRGCKQLSAAAIEARWSEIAKAVLDLPEVDFDELDLGIRNEWIEVRKPSGAADTTVEGKGIPQWDKKAGRLTFDGQLIRDVAKRAHNCIAVLDAFEEEGWPLSIDDPLPTGKDAERLNNTVRSLNDGIRVIRFSAAGDGQSIVWNREK